MGERKVLNKHIPADFDPSKIPRRKQPKNQQMKVRNMLPMSIRCKTCGNYMSRGTKFNCRKEENTGEDYLGIKIVRFYFKCSECSAEFTIKTDPQNSDYVVESGVTRNFEPWRNEDEEVEARKRKRDVEEMGNAVRSSENRMQDCKREMDRDAAIDELVSMRSRRDNVSADAVLEVLKREAEEAEKQREAEYKAIAASAFGKKRELLVRIHDEDVEDEDDDGDEETIPNRSGGETWNCNFKRIKASKDLRSRSDYPTEASDSDGSNNNANSNKSKSIFKSSLGTVTVMIKRKSPTTSMGEEQVTREEDKQGGELEAKDSTGLQSLQNYNPDG